MRAAALLSLGLAAALRSVGAQPHPSSEEGRPLYQRRYDWEDHGQNSQNWAAAQDPRGVVFVANTDGLLEFGGREWRSHRLPEGSRQSVLSLDVGTAGQVYVGGLGEVGVMRPDSVGRLRYVSLLPHVPHAARDFMDVWTTHAARDGVYFQTFNRLLRWDGRRMRAWSSTTRFFKGFEVGGTYYVLEEGVGLRRVMGDRLVTVPGGARFADRAVFALLPHPGGLLAAIRDEGLVLWRNGRSTPLEGVASAYLRRFQPYNAVALNNPYGRGRLYAIATFGGGVLVVDEVGRAIRIYGEDVGLTDADLVLYAAMDRQGGLWLALNDGIRRFDALGPLTRFGHEDGLLGSVYDVGRVGGVLYAATSLGLFRLVPGRLGLALEPDGQPAFARFEPVPGAPSVQTWALLHDGIDLLVATNEGVFAVRGRAGRLVQPTKYAFALHRSRLDPDRVYIGRMDGLGLLVRGPEGWKDGGMVHGVTGEIRRIVEDERGDLWLAPVEGGLLRVQVGAQGAARVQTFGPAEGLPAGRNHVTSMGGRVAVLTRAGLYRLQEGGAGAGAASRGLRFVPDPALASPSDNYAAWAGAGGRLWARAPDGLRAYRAGRGGRLEDVTPPGLGLRGLQIESLYEEPSGVVWVGAANGLVRYDPGVRRPVARFRALIRAVEDHHGTTVFGGAFGEGRATQAASEVLALPYGRNDLRFAFAAPAFNRHDLTEYQVRLDGHDEAWTPWSPEAVAEFTNLREGAYRFRMRARDAQGDVSEEAVYGFRVLPPWYRAWWAYALYVAVLTALIAAAVLSQIRRHQATAERERALNLRLDRFNTRLSQTNRRLREADKLKDDLLANTSHELRTPLTAILGFSSLLAEEGDEDSQDLARIIHRSGQRLLNTVNDLLDLAKLRADRVELTPQALDVAEAARGVVEMLRPLADEKGLWLRLEGADAPVPAVLDPYGLERVLTNLVGNAIKFTEGGGVTLRLDPGPDVVVVEVADTGIGMSPEFLPHVFEEFKQESTGYERSHEGTGLGLSIVRRVVTLMRGTIGVESRVGEGTTFEVRFPRDARRRALVSGDGAPPPPEGALEGVRVLGVEVPWPAQEALRAALGAGATLHFADSLDEAVRLARQLAYDVVVAGEPPAGRGLLGPPVRPAAVLRALPGYTRVPLVALVEGGVDQGELGALGYDLHLTLPLGHGAILDLFEDLLTREEYLMAR